MMPVFEFTDLSPEVLSVRTAGLGDYKLADKVLSAIAAPPPKDWRPSGIEKSYYLDMTEKLFVPPPAGRMMTLPLLIR